jgi:hypothetical protein
MLNRAVLPLLLSVLVIPAAASSSFDGKWDLTVPSDERNRAWWLEVRGAGTPSASGSFIGAPGGGLDAIENVRVDAGELRWTIRKPKRVLEYRARIAGNRLEGTLEEDGKTTAFHGVRAPKFASADAALYREGTPVHLFNGKDLSGWKPTHTRRPMKWSVEDGILKNAPGTTDIVTEGKFWNFRLQGEYRVGEHSNSGIGLRGRYEVQILEDYGKAASDKGNGALYSRIKPSENASKPANEWQTFDITLLENVVTVNLNGKTVIDHQVVEGLTAIATDPNEGEPGPIILQGDHGSVEVRKLTLIPLVKR